MVKIKDEFKNSPSISRNEREKSILLSSQQETPRSTKRLTFVQGTKQAPPQLSPLPRDKFDIGYPGSYAHEVLKTVLTQQDSRTSPDISKQLLLTNEKKEITFKLLLPLPAPLLTILHHCLPLLLFLQLAAFILILMDMQADDYWLSGWTIRKVSMDQGWINGTMAIRMPFVRFVPIIDEHVILRNHLWYAWNLMVFLYLPLAILHMIFTLEQKNVE